MKAVLLKEPGVIGVTELEQRPVQPGEARKYYHVTTNLNNIPALETLTDAQLPELFSNNDARQLIHITYGLILNEKALDGSYRFRDRLYKVWRQYDKEYMQRLERHIGRHLELLYSGFTAQKNL